MFVEFLLNFGFKQLITKPTHISGSILDLVITNQNNLINNVSIEPSFSNSDHFSIKFYINTSKERTVISRYKNLTLDNINKIKPLLAYNFGFMESIPYIKNNVNTRFENIFNLIQTIIDQNIPLITFKENTGQKYPRYIRKAIREKYKLFTLYKANNELKNEYNKICNKTKYLINNFLNSKISKISNNKSMINNFIKNSIKSKQNIPVLLYNNKYIFDDNEKCEIFGNYFSEIFINNFGTNNKKPEFTLNIKNTLEDIDFDIITVANTLKNLPNKNSTTQNDISYKILKNCHDILAPTLCELFRNSLDSGDIPDKWKNSIIIPIYKNGNRACIQNYRPISLTSTTCRVFEKILASEILKFLLEMI
uniref:Uncharacterized protein n=1 Tax=Meloidogyne enterolobii TaxID=390850 RepID=A0A6V7XC53_MELEN|nr:unnamed protein product [Meloidogyne enterolobii]